MTSLTVEILQLPTVQRVTVTDDALTVDLSDGRTTSVPLAWYPRLLHGTPEERNNWRLIGGQGGIHWIDLDEDISIDNLILGKPSAESQTSFQRWLEKRASYKGSGGAPKTSKYSPLYDFLAKKDDSVTEVNLTFKEIEKILGADLPKSAYRYRQWWANPSSQEDHPYAQAWLTAGWKVKTVNLSKERVRFRRA